MPKHVRKDYQNLRGVGKKVSYQIIIKHRGELSEVYLEAIKDCLWGFMGNIPKSNISIKKINDRGGV